jgi:hypothetical protein
MAMYASRLANRKLREIVVVLYTFPIISYTHFLMFVTFRLEQTELLKTVLYSM